MQGLLLRLCTRDTCPAWLAAYNAVAIQASGHVLVSPSINNQEELGYFILDTGVCAACCLQEWQAHIDRTQLQVIPSDCEVHTSCAPQLGLIMLSEVSRDRSHHCARMV